MTENLDSQSISLLGVCFVVILIAFWYRPRRQRHYVDSADLVFESASSLMQEMPGVLLEGIGSGRVSMTIEWDIIRADESAMVAKPKIVFEAAVPSVTHNPMPSLMGDPILNC